MSIRRYTLAVLVLSAGHAAASQRRPATPWAVTPWAVTPSSLASPNELQDAAVTLWGNRLPGIDTSLVFNRTVLQDVASILRIIRATIPDLSRAVGHPSATAVSLVLNAAAGRQAVTIGRAFIDQDVQRWQFPRRNGAPTLGRRSLDSLNRLFGATSATMTVADPKESNPGALVTIEFGPYVNLPRLVSMYQRSSDVSVAVEGPSIVEDPYRPVVVSLDSTPDTWQFAFDESRGTDFDDRRTFIRTLVRFNRGTRTATLVRRDTTGVPLR